MSAADTEAARQSAQASVARAATAIRDGGATVPHPAPLSLNPRRRALMEMADRQAEIIASAAAALLEIQQMIRDLPAQRPEPAGAVVPNVKHGPPLVFGQPNPPAIASPPPGTAGDDAPARTECADHPRSGD